MFNGIGSQTFGIQGWQPPVGGAAYVMPAAPGSFALAGVAVGLTYKSTTHVQYVIATPIGAVAINETADLEYAIYGTQISEKPVPVPPTSGSPYTLTAAPAAFVLAGTTTGLVYIHHYTMPATTAAFVLTGRAAGFIDAHGMSVTPGTFALAGTTTGLRIAHVMTAATAAFTLSGTATGLRIAHTLAVTKGTFTLAGTSTGLRAAHTMPAVKATFTLTGISANLVYGLFVNHYQLIAAPAAFTLAGNAVNLNKTTAYRLAVTVGAFTLSGNATRLAIGRVLPAATGAIVLSGKAANLVQVTVRKLVANTGVFTLTGYNTGLITHANKTILATPTSFVFSGQPIVLSRPRGFAAAPSQFVLSGKAANLHWSRPKMPAAVGQFRLTGYDTELTHRGDEFHLPIIGQPGRLEFGRKVFVVPGRW
jgi:hypothetical protein